MKLFLIGAGIVLIGVLLVLAVIAFQLNSRLQKQQEEILKLISDIEEKQGRDYDDA